MNTINPNYIRLNRTIKLLSRWVVLGLLATTEASAQNFWKQTNGPYEGTVYSFAVNSSGHIFAGTDDRIFRSTDNGNTWMPTLLSHTGVSSLAINASGHIYAGTRTDGIFRSTDNGNTWTQVNNGLENKYVGALAVDPVTQDIFAGTVFSGVFRSSDNGNSWTQAGLPTGYIISLAISASGQIFAVNGADGVFRSTDNGNTWTPVNSGLSDAVSTLAINSSGHIFAGTSNLGVFRSTDNGNTWTSVGLPTVSIYSLAVNPNGHIFAGTYGGIVFHSTDNGNTWTSVTLPTVYVASLAVNNTKGYVFAGTSGAGATSGGVFRSTDNGNTWTPVGLQTTSVLSVAINASGYTFAGTSSSGVFRASDNGNTWAPTGLQATSVYSLAINASGQIFAGTVGTGVFRSSDNGNSWTAANTGLMNVNALSFAINTSGQIFAGTAGGGVFRSSDNGNNWTPVNAGLTYTDIKAIAINSSGLIFLGTGGGGVLRSADLGPPIISHVPTLLQTKDKEITIDATITDDIGVVTARLNYRQGGDPAFSSFELKVGTNNNYHGTIIQNAVKSRGVEYYFVATDSFGNIARFPSSGIFSVQIRVGGEGEIKRDTQGNIVSQPNGSEQNAYHLFSVPLDVDDKSPKAILEDDLGPYDKKKWRFYALRDGYYMLPVGTSIYAEFPDTAKIRPGRAFWLIVKDEGKLINTGPGVSNKTDKEYPIALYPGWNFIGNPFNFPIPAERLRLKSRGKPPALRYFSGEWNKVTSNPVREILPFEGYAIFDSTITGDTLLVNPDLSVSSSQLFKQTTSQREEILFSIQVLAQCQEARDVDNVVIVAADASRNQNSFDQPEPPVIGEYVSVYFPHRDWNTLAKTYCIDARPEPTDGEVWEFDVKTNIRDKVNLTFEGIDEVPEEFEVWLVDDALQITQNLREQRQYAVAGAAAVAGAEAGAEHVKPLKLVVGKRDFVDEKLAEARAIPTTYELSQNFPNPFNPATTIRYGLPSAERVTLKIYNLLGAEVATLVNDEPQAAGYHAAIWDGRDKAGRVVASGVYVYRMQAGGFTMTKKLALVK